jgi:hypothetical protein
MNRNKLSVVTALTASSYDLRGVCTGLEKIIMHTEFEWENLLDNRNLKDRHEVWGLH